MSLRLQNVIVRLSPKTPFESLALNIPSLEVPTEARIIGIFGHTGSGKSTFLRLVGGLLQPSEGLIETSFVRSPPHTMIVLQQPESQLFCSTVREELLFALQNFGIACNGDQDLQVILDRCGPWPNDVLNRSPFELSGGQMRRVALASVFVASPGTVLLDEPVAGLDWVARREVLKMLLEQKRCGSVFFVSHELEELLAMSDTVLGFESGSVFFVGSPSGFLMEYADVSGEPLEFLHSLRQRFGVVDE